MQCLSMIYFVVKTSTFCFAQDYVPLVREGAYWCYACSWGEHDYGVTGETVHSFTIMHDTTIAGFTYKNVGVIQRWSHGVIDNTYYNADKFIGFYGGIREDSGRVYFYKYPSMIMQGAFSIPDSTEVLLYNFNVGIGDTIKKLYPETTFYSIVTAIDSISLLDSQFYRNIHVNNYTSFDDFWSNGEWIEGLGHKLLGLFSDFVWIFEGPPECSFISYSYADFDLFSNGTWGGCK